MCALPKAAIFDLDGILLDTEPLYTAATQAVVAEFGKEYTWDIKRRIMGGSALRGAEIIVSELALPISAQEYLERRRRILEQSFRDTRPIAGAQALVQVLAELGLPLAIATSSERSLSELKCGPHAWLTCFTVVVCGDDTRIRNAKPAPDIFRIAARELAVDPAQCVVFEDSPNGVRAAAASGARVIARRDPSISREELASASVIIERYADLELPAAIEIQ